MIRPVCFAVVLCIASVDVMAQINREAPMFTPVIDGVVSPAEMVGQLEVPMVWPVEGGALVLENSGFSKEELSATWYVSWDTTNLYIAGVVLDDTPTYRLASGGAYNAQDLIQPVFNPNNDEDHLFVDGIPADDEVFDEVAAIYDFVVETADEFGPDVYRHGHLLSADGYESITMGGTINEDESGYTIEASIPWETAMDDEDSDYVPSLDDVHGLSFILVGFSHDAGAGEAATLITDFGDGANTIGDPLTWNSITLVGSVAAPGDFNGNGELDAADLDALTQDIQSPGGNAVFDLNGDGNVDSKDHTMWIKDLKNTWVGDSNLDGEFNSSDMVQVFTAGKYDKNEPIGWGEGDWDGNTLFNSGDFVVAFTDGGYELGPPPGGAAVPEPSAVALLVTGGLIAIRRRRS